MMAFKGLRLKYKNDLEKKIKNQSANTAFENKIVAYKTKRK